ncbi:MAG: response regulator [Nitrospinota bacterium]
MIKRRFTTGKVAELCGVSVMSVWNWINEGKLKAYRTPGGHFRILADDFDAFIKDYQIPLEGETPAFEGKRVMVVDDEADEVEAIIAGLHRRIPQVEFSSASDGYEALLKIGHAKPHLVILDLRMPRVDGFKVCQELKSNPLTQHIAIIAISAYGTEADIARVREMGADFFLHKPLNLEELEECIRESLGLRQPAMEGKAF